MANIEIFGTLVRNDNNTNRDKIVKGSQVEGGYFVCETLPSEGTWLTGQLCYCKNKFYKYNGSKWAEYNIPNVTVKSSVPTATEGNIGDICIVVEE
jgi:hypothetical protein